MRGVALVIGVIGAISLAIGCGGSDETVISKSAFVRQGEVICAKGKAKRYGDMSAAVTAAQKTGELGGRSFARELLLDIGLPPVVRMTQELAELGESDDRKAGAIVAAFEAGIETTEADPLQGIDGADPFAEAKKLAAAYGLKSCGQI
jgi:hypothetical protein